MRIYEIVSEDYNYANYTRLDEGLKEILLTAGMAGVIALSALGGSAPSAPATPGANKPVPVKITSTPSGGGTTAQFADGSSTVHTGNNLSIYNSAGSLVKTVKPAPGAELPGEETAAATPGAGEPNSGEVDAASSAAFPDASGEEVPAAGNAVSPEGPDAASAAYAPPGTKTNFVKPAARAGAPRA